METLLDMAADGDTINLMVMALIFVPAALIAFFVMRAMRLRGHVKRRV